MTLNELDTPMPNLLGKLTTSLQIIYIAVVFLKEILNLEFGILTLDIIIIIITVMSLLVYAYSWYKDIKIFHNE